jgi:uncharacterized protein (DUF1778 family)
MIFTATALVACTFGAAALFFRTRRNRMSAKTRISAQVDVTEYNLIRKWADKNGKTLSEYVRETLLASVPEAEKAHAARTPESMTVEDKAWEEIDKSDEVNTGMPGVLPIPPARRAQPGVVTEANRTHPMQRVTKVTPSRLPQVPPGVHPCVHLSLSVPANMRGQCQGTCTSQSQRGKVCFWTPTTARSCPVFEGKETKNRNLIAR